nr:hypothetical protein [Tanacetum cinerariifolium]
SLPPPHLHRRPPHPSRPPPHGRRRKSFPAGFFWRTQRCSKSPDLSGPPYHSPPLATTTPPLPPPPQPTPQPTAATSVYPTTTIFFFLFVVRAAGVRLVYVYTDKGAFGWQIRTKGTSG